MKLILNLNGTTPIRFWHFTTKVGSIFVNMFEIVNNKKNKNKKEVFFCSFNFFFPHI